MEKARIFIAGGLALVVAMALSCAQPLGESGSIKATDAMDAISKGYYVGPFSFDWEHETYISFKGNQILLPWTSGARAASIPLGVLNDRNASDGWTLLYNNFPVYTADPVLILYNKFKGIVRVFMYVTNTTYTASNFTWGFAASTLNCSTSAFNFTKAVPEPHSVKYKNPTVYNINYCSNSASVPNGITPESWYYSDFEVMYDPGIATLTHDDIDLRMQNFCTDKKYISTTGKISGTLQGTFSLPSSGSSSGVFSDLVKNFDINKLGTLSFPTLDTARDYLSDYATKQVNTTLKNLFSQGLAALGSSLSTTNPIIKALTGGLFSTSSSSPGKINCALQAKTTSESVLTGIVPGPNVAFLFPGTATTNKGGILPNYSQLLGVFHVESKPIVHWSHTQTLNEQGEYDVYNYCSLAAAPKIVINPAVVTICRSISTTAELVYTRTDPTATVSGELIDSHEGVYRYRGDDIVESYSAPRPQSVRSCMVRVTVSMTPSGGTNPIVIVKEYKPTLVDISPDH